VLSDVLDHVPLTDREVRRSKRVRANITPEAFLNFKARDWSDLLYRECELFKRAEVVGCKALKQGLAKGSSDLVDTVKVPIPSCWFWLYYRFARYADQNLVLGIVHKSI
jgi:hypothetical protein